MKFHILLLLLLLLSIKQSISQTHRVDFEKKNGTKGFRSIQSIIAPETISENNLFKGIPPSYSTYSISKVMLNSNKKKHKDYLDGKINQDEYLAYIDKFCVDTTSLAKSFVECCLYIYSGLDKINQKKILIPDCNNNNDFSDDSVFIFNIEDYKLGVYSKEQSLLYPEILIGKADSMLVSMKINPFDTFYAENKYASEDEYMLDFVLLTNSYLEGYLRLNNKTINIIEHKQHTKDLTSNNLTACSLFRFFEEDSINTQSNSYHIGDTVFIANNKILIQSADNLRLNLKGLGVHSQDKILSGVYSKDVKGNQKIYLKDLIKDKYVFIDFWGSWCKPCIASIPKLKDLYNTIKKREDVLLLGIALEKDADGVRNLQNIINKNDMGWLNVWNSFSESKSLSSPHGIFAIEKFPTYLILDKNGRVLYNPHNESWDEAFINFVKLINSNE